MLPDCGDLINRLSPSLSPDGAVSKSLVESGGVNTASVPNAGAEPNYAEMPGQTRLFDAARGIGYTY